MNLKQFSKNLKYLRSLVGATQEQMAAMLGLKRSAFGAWEEGRSYPNAPGLIALCNLLDIDNPRDLLARDLSAPELVEQAAKLKDLLLFLKVSKAPPQKRSRAHITHNCASIY